MLSIGLIFSAVTQAGSINPTLRFQNSIEHHEYNRLAYVILNEAYRRIGHPVAEESVNNMPFDGILISPNNSALNQDYIRIPIAIIQLKVFAYAHKSQENTGYEFGLLGNRVTIVDGMPIVANSMAGMIVGHSMSVNHSFKSVLRNQSDLVLLPELIAISRSKKHLRQQVVALQPAVYQVPMYHYVSKRNKHLVESIAYSIRAMEKQQLIAHVTQSYKHVLEADSES